MIYTTQMLAESLAEYGDPAGKIMRMTEKEEIHPLTRGLYETEDSAPGHCLACAIYHPSYLSFDYALAHYGLVPATDSTYTSATCNKKKAKKYTNFYGTYTFRDVPEEAYSFGIVTREENGYSYYMATPEKALCDKLWSLPPVHSQKEIKELLVALQLDESKLKSLNRQELLDLCEKYHSNTLKYFKKYLEKQ